MVGPLRHFRTAPAADRLLGGARKAGQRAPPLFSSQLTELLLQADPVVPFTAQPLHKDSIRPRACERPRFPIITSPTHYPPLWAGCATKASKPPSRHSKLQLSNMATHLDVGHNGLSQRRHRQPSLVPHDPCLPRPPFAPCPLPSATCRLRV